MSTIDEAGPTPEFRDRVHAAAREELTRWGIDRFSIMALADRNGLAMAEILQFWADDATLIIDVLLDGAGRQATAPDTGSLREDLYALAAGMAAYVGSDQGHQIQGSHLIGEHFVDGIEIRRTLWRVRAQRLSVVFERALDRGELRAGVDAAVALEMLLAPINMRALFTGEAIDEAYCRQVADLVWQAIRS
ncbi:TetR-like C-terminal domain-containing protein [Mycolicibacterium sp. J2]|uniref:TetR-like C-terminal domain-containing protein n=1 Tax=Mycolicibacterium sp. J2 TaxID=2993511 RepID=UPI00224B34EE|nr:TetR-like C-terminal domain-containing protein [Mycolicibacterium sp. J2]MCX2712827.1 TetR-like C-terminal domain-containing protein [Mycolicibacterium sp. J2]